MISSRFFKEVFFDETYRAVRDLGKKPVAIDVGATTGEFSLWASQQFETIYAIEPVIDLFNYLKENTGDFPQIKVFNLALGDKNRSGYMVDSSIGASRLLEDESVTDCLTEVQTLATFMQKNNIEFVDCLKIDIEDGEKQVFESEDFKDVAEKIGFIIGEHVPHLVSGLLKSLGFHEFENEGGHFYKRP